VLVNVAYSDYQAAEGKQLTARVYDGLGQKDAVGETAIMAANWLNQWERKASRERP